MSLTEVVFLATVLKLEASKDYLLKSFKEVSY